MATGAYLTGKKPVVLMQNSGLGYSLEVFASLHSIYRIPMLVVMSWRGKPGHEDYIEHQVMGQITRTTLDALEFPYYELTGENISALLDQSEEALVRDQTVFLLVGKGVFS